MAPGDAIFFDVAVVHGSGPNRSSDRRRRALQMQYAPADARPTRCPRGRDDVEVTVAVGDVFDDGKWCDDSGGEPTAWFDCDASIRCTEPQYVARSHTSSVWAYFSVCFVRCPCSTFSCCCFGLSVASLVAILRSIVNSHCSCSCSVADGTFLGCARYWSFRKPEARVPLPQA